VIASGQDSLFICGNQGLFDVELAFAVYQLLGRMQIKVSGFFELQDTPVKGKGKFGFDFVRCDVHFSGTDFHFVSVSRFELVAVKDDRQLIHLFLVQVKFVTIPVCEDKDVTVPGIIAFKGIGIAFLVIEVVIIIEGVIFSAEIKPLVMIIVLEILIFALVNVSVILGVVVAVFLQFRFIPFVKPGFIPAVLIFGINGHYKKAQGNKY
jgi:hypothetical protein